MRCKRALADDCSGNRRDSLTPDAGIPVPVANWLRTSRGEADRQVPGCAISPRGRGLDDDRLAGVDHGRVAAFELLDRAVLAPHRVLARLTGLAARHAERRHDAVAGQQRAVHFLQEADGAADAVARVPLALAARALADVEVLQHHRIAEFENLRIGETRVGHVRVHGVGAVEAGAGGRAGADRLVVLIRLVAEVEVVHRALRAGERAERAEQAVGHRLAHLDIAGDDGGGIFRRQHRVLRDDEIDRTQAARRSSGCRRRPSRAWCRARRRASPVPAR